MEREKFFRFVDDGGRKIVICKTPSITLTGWPCGVHTKAPFENWSCRAKIRHFVFLLASAKHDHLCQRGAEFLNNWANLRKTAFILESSNGDRDHFLMGLVDTVLKEGL